MRLNCNKQNPVNVVLQRAEQGRVILTFFMTLLSLKPGRAYSS